MELNLSGKATQKIKEESNKNYLNKNSYSDHQEEKHQRKQIQWQNVPISGMKN